MCLKMTGWWFHPYVLFSPLIFGEMIQFDLRICLKWVGSTTNRNTRRQCASGGSMLAVGSVAGAGNFSETVGPL